MDSALHFKIFFRHAALLLASAAISSCATLSRNALPVDHLGKVQIAGMSDNIRALGIKPNLAFQHDFAKAMVDGGPEAGCDKRAGQPVFCVLIISGGGGFGAYGAGVLNGWSQSGQRPEFKIVTGISTGALIAPFAFLGSEWDEELATAFRTIENNEDIVDRRGLLGILTKDSLARNDPLRARISAIVTSEMLEAIAREHRRGRRLYVGTTNLDTQQLTVWNLGAIANSNMPGALPLFRKVLLASASIPIASGKSYDEMHVDGSVQAQFFVPLVVIDLPAAIAEARSTGFDYYPTPRMFIIRNAKFIPEEKITERSLGKIVTRTVESMIQSMGRGDLYQIYAIAKARGNDFYYTEMPASFKWQSQQEFDGPEMRRLFDIGVENGLTKETWQRTPSGLFATNIEPVDSPD